MQVFYEDYHELNQNEFNMADFADMNFPAHLHNSFELIFISQGSMNVTVNGKAETASNGDIIVILPNDIHSFETAENSEGWMIFFTNLFLPELNELFKKNTFENHVIKKINSNIQSLIKEFDEIKKNPYSSYYFKGYIYDLFYKILPVSNLIEKPTDTDQIMLKKLLIFVQKEYDKGLNLNETAAFLGMSQSSISRYFIKSIGCSFNEYIGRLRIEKSKNLLSDSDLSILETALECGFENQRNFNRVFMKYQSCTPSEYRKKYRQEYSGHEYPD